MNMKSLGVPAALGAWGILGAAAALPFAMQGMGCSGRLDLGTVADKDASPAKVLAPSSSENGTGGSGSSIVGTFTAVMDDASVGSNDFDDASSGSGDDGSSGEASGDNLVDATFDPVAPGLAGFGFVVDDQVQHPMNCPSDDWEFSGSGLPIANCEGGACNPPSSLAYLINTGQFPVAYIAAAGWDLGAHYVPGVATGNPNELVGVLDVGAQVDITSVYAGGITALLGSSAPFSSPDAGKYLSDEGSIPWPAGVAGSEGSSTMWLAEIEVRPSCEIASQVW
jgi:hypothetical protein